MISKIICLTSLLFFTACNNKNEIPPGWISPGGNSSNTYFYTRPSPILIKHPKLNLLWNSGFIKSLQGSIYVNRTQYLSTALNSEKPILGMFKGGISFFRGNGDLMFHYTSNDLTFGFLFDVEGKGSLSAFISTNGGLFKYNLRGILLDQFPSQSYVLEINIGKLVDKEDYSLITSEIEPVPVPVGVNLVEWHKRIVRCYDIQTNKRKWEYRIANFAHIAAIEDINKDFSKEIVCGSYSPENRMSWEDMVDTGRGYVFTLDHLGKRLWLQTFYANYANIWPCIADLDKDGNKEIIVACGSWLRNWGCVYVLNAIDGKILYKFPSKGNLNYSITALGIADLDGDGKKEIICSSIGQHGSFFILDNHCKQIGTNYYISPSNMEYSFVGCKLGAINDIDGDGKPEIIGSASVEKVIAKDPRFMYSKYFDSQLLILSSDLTLKTSLSFEEPCTEVIVSDLIPGGTNEIITLTDKISVYGIKEEEQ